MCIIQSSSFRPCGSEHRSHMKQTLLLEFVFCKWHRCPSQFVHSGPLWVPKVHTPVIFIAENFKLFSKPFSFNLGDFTLKSLWSWWTYLYPSWWGETQGLDVAVVSHNIGSVLQMQENSRRLQEGRPPPSSLSYNTCRETVLLYTPGWGR